MTKRVIMVCLWAVLFFFSGVILHLVAVSIVLDMTIPSGSKPGVIATIMIGFTWILMSLTFGIAGLILGLSGRLPGTRKKIL